MDLYTSCINGQDGLDWIGLDWAGAGAGAGAIGWSVGESCWS